MRRVADELGIQAPSLYKHFASKAELELALLNDAMIEMGDASHRRSTRAVASPPSCLCSDLSALQPFAPPSVPPGYGRAAGPRRAAARPGGVGREPLVRGYRRSLSRSGFVVLRPRDGHPGTRWPVPSRLRPGRHLDRRGLGVRGTGCSRPGRSMGTRARPLSRPAEPAKR